MLNLEYLTETMPGSGLYSMGREFEEQKPRLIMNISPPVPTPRGRDRVAFVQDELNQAVIKNKEWQDSQV